MHAAPELTGESQADDTNSQIEIWCIQSDRVRLDSAANKLPKPNSFNIFKVLKSSNVQKWVNGAAKANRKSPEAAETLMVSTLAACYGDEGLATVRIAHDLPITTQELKAVQPTNWMVKHQTANDVSTSSAARRARNNDTASIPAAGRRIGRHQSIETFSTPFSKIAACDSQEKARRSTVGAASEKGKKPPSCGAAPRNSHRSVVEGWKTHCEDWKTHCEYDSSPEQRRTRKHRASATSTSPEKTISSSRSFVAATLDSTTAASVTPDSTK
ncbi:unnamed protein product [Phytophthora fragariaefolia]|uniref:Unnamed protein product n=1 Tax=Phytophthora fragariaefolia TaxID=1490495 RepID=A0A9W6TYH5_9STRA|nr:unnamed protein product [Phytophthora fragariaefolia]